MLINLDGKEFAITVIKSPKDEGKYEYYLGDKRIGVLDTKIMEDNILILQNTIENEIASQIKDSIDRLPREEIEKEGELAAEIDTYLNEFGERDERAKSISIINLDEEERDEERDENEEEEKEDRTTRVDDVHLKQVVDTGERANDMHDIRKWFGLPQEVVQIGVIESYQMKGLQNAEGEKYSNNTTRYSLVAIGRDGKVRPLSEYIPELEQRDSTGNNPTRESYQVDSEGRVEEDAVLSEYQFGKKIIQIDNRETGRIEIIIGEEARNSTEMVGMQVRTDNVMFAIDTETRSVIGEYEQNGENTVERNIGEAEEHPDPAKDEMDRSDIDGDENTKSHTHTENEIELANGTKLTWDELAIRWGYRDENGDPDGERAFEKYSEEQNENPEKTPEEIIEKIDEELEEQIISSNERGE